LLVIVDFAIEDDLELKIVIGGHGLPPGAGEVDDGEPAVAEGAVCVMPDSTVIGATVNEGIDHRRDTDGVSPRIE
jgi:hypothetical protein